MKKFNLFTKTLLVAVCLLVGASNAWGAGYTRTLNDALVVSGYKVKAFYDFQNNDPAVLPTSGDLRYRAYENGGYWGFHNFGSGGRSAAVTIPVASTDILIIQEGGSANTTINVGTQNAGLSTSTGYKVFDITSTAASVTFSVARGCDVVAALVMEEDKTVATPTFTVGSYNYEQGGYAVTPSCETEGATLTYTIGGGAATACTSGVPFYAKDGAVQITATKTGWTTSTTPEKERWTLNVAPSSTSPETLIPFQKSSDNGDKNIEHVYKSVTIAGGSSGAIAGIVANDANALKLRTNQSSNTITLNVNSGYTVTRVSIAAKSNNKAATIGLTSTTVDGGSNIMASTTTFPISTAASATFDTNGTAINAKNNIVFTFDNSAIDGTSDKKNNQILATIEVWYKTPVENAIDDCKSHETSSAFATAIDAQSFASAEEVYAFHTAWQIENASDNDITKVIFDAAVSDFTRWNGGRSNNGQQYTGAPDNKYFDGWDKQPSDGKQKIYGLPAGTYTIKVATRASEALIDKSKYNVWVYGGSADVSVLGSHIGNAGGSLGNGWNWTILSFTLVEKADVEVGFYANPGTGTGLWAGCDDFHLYKGMLAENVSVTVSEAGYATYVSPYALDFTSTDIKAHTAVVNTTTGVITLTEKNQIPSNTPVVLYYAGGKTEDIPVIAAADDLGDNDLKAGKGAAVYTEDGAGHYNYVLDDVAGIGFYKANGVTVASDRAYLQTTYNVSGSAARGMSIVFADDILTGISEAAAATEAVAKEGKFVVDGKLVIFKKGMKFNANGAKIK